MRSFPAADKAIYINQAILDGYEEYMKNIGGSYKIEIFGTGSGVTAYNNVPLLVEPIWEPILEELGGVNTHAAILTLRGNFVFATDKNYGEEDDFETPQALHVWREKKELSWYWQMFLKAGTQIALPEHTVVALSTFN